MLKTNLNLPAKRRGAAEAKRSQASPASTSKRTNRSLDSYTNSGLSSRLGVAGARRVNIIIAGLYEAYGSILEERSPTHAR